MEFEYKTLFDLKKVVQNYNLKLTGILFRFVFLFQLPNMSENVQLMHGSEEENSLFLISQKCPGKQWGFSCVPCFLNMK